MNETTKATMNPALKETYGKRAVNTTQGMVKEKSYVADRVCSGCGKKRLGNFCRECGESTMEIKKVTRR